jgi:hypothetical protein
MKKQILLLAALPIIFSANAQTFSDDFETYTAGDFIAQKSNTWETWTSKTGGGADDAKVVNNKAKSGSNSLYFSSTVAAGGPQDIILPFGGQYTTGDFTLGMNLFVETGKSAYFNFQEQTVAGKGYTFDVYFETTGDLSITNTKTGLVFSGKFPHNQWFNLNIKSFLNTNTWEILIDNISQGTFQNGSYQIATMDLFPLQGSSFWVDDVTYEYTAPASTFTKNAAISAINDVLGYLSGSSVVPSIQIRNIGTETITEAEIKISYNNQTEQLTFSGLNIAKNTATLLKWQNPWTIAAGSNTFIAEIVSVNQSSDENNLDNIKQITVDPVVPATDKMVIGEEATGTWCAWCPRGAVSLKNMDAKYKGYFQGIAIHNNDPMEDYTWDAGLNNKISGYPSAIVDRGSDVDPSAMDKDFLKRIVQAPKGVFYSAAQWNSVTRELKVCLKTTIKSDISGNYKLVCALVEDSVTGTSSGYNQSNAYAGGSNGVMGGFELLANPVPASKMVYDHVGRYISPSFNGLNNAYGSSAKQGDTFIHNFTFPVNADWNFNKMHIVSMFIDPSGAIDNGFSIATTEALNNTFVTGTEVLATKNLAKPSFKVTPSPAHEYLTISLNEPIHLITIMNVNGAIIQTNSASVSGETTVNISSLTPGIYLVSVQTENGLSTRKFIKE